MEYIRISAKTVEDAIIEASIQLGTAARCWIGDPERELKK